MESKIDLLLAKEDDTMRDNGVVHLLHLPIAERPRQIDIADLGPDMRRRRGYRNRVVAHRFSLRAGLGSAGFDGEC